MRYLEGDDVAMILAVFSAFWGPRSTRNPYESIIVCWIWNQFIFATIPIDSQSTNVHFNPAPFYSVVVDGY